MANTLLLVFPHQLFADHPGLDQNPDEIVFVEDPLFFGDIHHPAAFHKQKIWLHRASMKRFASHLESTGRTVTYLEHDREGTALRQRIERFSKTGGGTIFVSAPHDYLLEKRLRRMCSVSGVSLEELPTPMFFNSREFNQDYRAGKKRWFMADFYSQQRRRLDILMDGDKPVGGKWSYDHDNRKKVPKAMMGSIPALTYPNADEVDEEAKKHVLQHYENNPGRIDTLLYPTSHKEAALWLERFFVQRFALFGDYEDAMVQGENWLWHSILTPMLNIGLLTPKQVVDGALVCSQKHDIPLNSLEGFLRQIIGWREFMRATYDDLGVSMRTTNHWNHTRPIPDSFYTGETGIVPIDDTIKRVLDTGYCHHIERLMVLGGFFFLCEIDPDDIYRWFMEMFVDSYDWVMVPNVYAMSQNADGGQITTKPYFSGSSYVRKMSNYKPGEWAKTWDGLYWRWIWNHADELGKNPRWAMMCSMVKKMNEEKREMHLQNAEAFLATL